jgi:protein gp37
MKETWARSIRNQCLAADVDFFFKQWGAWGADGKQRNKKANGRLLDGKLWDMIPSVAV